MTCAVQLWKMLSGHISASGELRSQGLMARNEGNRNSFSFFLKLRFKCVASIGVWLVGIHSFLPFRQD